MKKWKHNELANDLAEHLVKDTARMVWTDMQLGPSGSPRPDVYTMPKTYTALRPLAYEVKVSVSDFRSDITSGKWQSYLRYASAVIFAVPQGLIKKEDLPPGCGLIVRGENSWRMAKGPTLATVTDLPRELWMKLLINGVDRSVRQNKLEYFNRYIVEDKIAAKYGKELAAVLHERDRAQQILEGRTAMIKEKIGDLDMFKVIEVHRDEIESMRTIKAELCALMGLDHKTGSWTIEREIKRRMDLLNESKNMQKTLSVIEQSLREVRRIEKNLTDLTAPLFEVNTHE